MKQCKFPVELNGEEEINQLHNLVTCFIETNQKVTPSGSFIMTGEIREAKDLLSKLENSVDNYVLIHEEDVLFMQGKV